MSRRVNQPVQVLCDAGSGEPSAIVLPRSTKPLPVMAHIDHWREWIGVLEGEPERDVWLVETPQGVCELHCLRYPTTDENEATGGDWVLFRWED